MRIVLFCHSLRSDWNHGNAHFLRGIVGELAARGHDVTAWEPEDSWSARHLRESAGDAALAGFRHAYPHLPVRVYDPATLNLDEALDRADLALFHEWNEPALVAAAGRIRARNPHLRLLFHDTHHRSVTDPESMARYDLSHYDGVLAFGESIRQQYLGHAWAHRVWTWHEAADTRVFHPLPATDEGDLVWIGNWGDGERSAELHHFLIEPVRALQFGDTRLRARVYGVRYPETAVRALHEAQIDHLGWVPNYLVPELFAHHRFTLHVPRRPYAEALPGIPTIRVFEALACGIPLISAPWQDTEHLFPESSFLRAQNGAEMQSHMRALMNDAALCASLARAGQAAIAQRHTCAHRVDELIAIYEQLEPARARLPDEVAAQ